MQRFYDSHAFAFFARPLGALALNTKRNFPGISSYSCGSSACPSLRGCLYNLPLLISSLSSEFASLHRFSSSSAFSSSSPFSACSSSQPGWCGSCLYKRLTLLAQFPSLDLFPLMSEPSLCRSLANPPFDNSFGPMTQSCENDVFLCRALGASHGPQGKAGGASPPGCATPPSEAPAAKRSLLHFLFNVDRGSAGWKKTLLKEREAWTDLAGRLGAASDNNNNKNLLSLKFALRQKFKDKTAMIAACCEKELNEQTAKNSSRRSTKGSRFESGCLSFRYGAWRALEWWMSRDFHQVVENVLEFNKSAKLIHSASSSASSSYSLVASFSSLANNKEEIKSELSRKKKVEQILTGVVIPRSLAQLYERR
eukprot:GHVT01020476.1.p1 GENE.GHVT01020476.1~~GHVT01020476.1.p1  ORF type:complete len:388 (+),score=70.96 GHVT01020476.1:66-1166(+)